MSKRAIPLSTDGKQNWETPQWFFDYLNKIYNFTFDLAASEENAKCEQYFDGSEGKDALVESWPTKGFCWCNPPFANLKPWVDKALIEVERGSKVVMLLPARLETKWAVKLVIRGNVQIITPRLQYYDRARKRLINNVPAGSMIVDLQRGLMCHRLPSMEHNIRYLDVDNMQREALRGQKKGVT